MIEIALIAALAFGLSCPVSGIAANSVGNKLLAQANEQITTEIFERISFGFILMIGTLAAQTDSRAINSGEQCGQ